MAGFIAVADQANGDYSGKLMTYAVDAAHATLLAPGDVVRISGDSDSFGVPEADAATAGQSITGVIASVEPNFEGEALNETGLPASTAGKIRVHVDPQLLFEVDVDATLAAADVGLNADINATAASKSGGLTVSNMNLDAGTKATTSTLQFRIVALLEDEDGTLGNRALVRMNNTTTTAGATGV